MTNRRLPLSDNELLLTIADMVSKQPSLLHELAPNIRTLPAEQVSRLSTRQERYKPPPTPELTTPNTSYCPRKRDHP